MSTERITGCSIKEGRKFPYEETANVTIIKLTSHFLLIHNLGVFIKILELTK